jgi:hypothetical protein
VKLKPKSKTNMENEIAIYDLENLHGKFIAVKEGNQILECYMYYDKPTSPAQATKEESLEKARHYAKFYKFKSVETLIEII